jgi:hypothetical protein
MTVNVDKSIEIVRCIEVRDEVIAENISVLEQTQGNNLGGSGIPAHSEPAYGIINEKTDEKIDHHVEPERSLGSLNQIRNVIINI